MKRHGLLVTLFVLGAMGVAVAQSAVINDNNVHRMFQGDDIRLVINGNHEDLTLVGVLGGIVVNGSDSHIDIQASGGDAIVVNGNNNHITWSRKARGDGGPSWVDNGIGNTLTSEP